LSRRRANTTSEKVEGVCVDSPSDWRSKTGSTCADYTNLRWCTRDGGKGDGWGGNGDFEDWVAEGFRTAAESCCMCGGGQEVDIFMETLGEEACSKGETITDAATCEAASRSLGATFSSAAAWPEGHPRGCHTDGRRSHVWLNMDPSGTAQDEFAILCADVADEEEADDDDDDDDDSASDKDEDDSERDGDDEDEDEREDKNDETKAAAVNKERRDGDKKAADAKEISAERAAHIKLEAQLREKVVHTHAALVHNLKRRVQVGLELHRLDGDDDAGRKDIEKHKKAVAYETRSKAMGNLMGDMWKEMRMFAVPFYEERLEEELLTLEKQGPELEEAYNKAVGELDKAEKSRPAA